MHTFTETAAGVPAFLAKLWRLVEDPETNNLICWSKDGRSFIIQNQAQFARELLPLNYKHNNMASFIRQLNMYGFHKITSLDNGCLKFDRDEMEFTHPCFKRNCPYLLEHIKRKLASTKSVDEKSALKPEAVTKVLHDVKAMRGRQDSLDSRFSVMKQENEALWREIASLRQKHAKQQQIVNKLIQFLITIVQPQRNMTSVKRHMQLMINDTPDKINVPKTDDSETKCGPVIHELGEDLMEEASEGESELVVPNTQFVRVTTPGASIIESDYVHSPHNLERPPSSGSTISQSFDFSNQDAEGESELINETPTGIAINDGLIQTVNNDGSQIFFHITEVPDAQPTECNNSPAIYNDDNVLTTPMVREEIARTKLLKEKNRQRRIKNINVAENPVQKGSPSSTNTMLKKKRQNNINEVPQALPVKSEDDSSIDPMLFLDAYCNNSGLAEEPHLISPNFNEHSPSRTDNDFLGNNNSDLYNPNNFITDGIPTDIFEDDALSGIDKNSNIGENRDLKNNQQQQFVNSNVNSGKFSKYSLRSASENDQQRPSTSAAATVVSLSNNNGNDNDDGTKSVESTVKCENFDGMALAKFNNNQDIMRLSTPDEVSGHLGVVQDELEGLKDLLRSDTYSLDSNTLLGLFNDTDILAPYTLNLNNDENDSNDKKGTLATYQPVYDLSDIINDQNDLDAESNIPTTSTLPSLGQSPEYSSSVLNTPYHQ